MLIYNPFFNIKNRIITYKFNNNEDLNIINNIKEWSISQNPSNTKSTHWWYYNLPENIKSYYKKLISNNDLLIKIKKNFNNYNPNSYNIDILDEMNEIYISPPSDVSNTSDKIFYTEHLDGPYFYVPFASCYRTIIAINENKEITTVFSQIPFEIRMNTGDLISFDYHRECHYIKKIENEKNTNYRIVLKVHYCIYNNNKIGRIFGKLLGRLTINYNYNFRNLFLYTINPKTYFEKFLAYIMIMSTKFYHDLEYYIGYNNISYILLLYLLSSQLFNYYLFIIGIIIIPPLRLIDNNNRNQLFIRDLRLYSLLSLILPFY